MEYYQHLVDKKITGNISEDEDKELIAWRKKAKENEMAFQRIHDAWHYGKPSVSIIGQKATWEKLSHRLDFSDRPLIESANKNQLRIPNVLKYAAAIALVLSALFIIKYYTPNTDQIGSVQSEWVIKSNPAGQKSGINLPDGSVCWLNSESEIRYLSNFTDSSRDLYLEGEAYFEVAKDKSKPFRVSTATMEVVALGTIFNISSFQGDNTETVSLVEGKIAVDCSDSYFEVLPGEAVKFDKTTKSAEKTSINVQETIAWKNGTLQFNEENYLSIFSKLERWYGVNISVVGNMPTQLKYKSKFKDESLVNVLESISYGHHFEYEIDGKNIKIIFH